MKFNKKMANTLPLPLRCRCFNLKRKVPLCLVSSTIMCCHNFSSSIPVYFQEWQHCTEHHYVAALLALCEIRKNTVLS